MALESPPASDAKTAAKPVPYIEFQQGRPGQREAQPLQTKFDEHRPAWLQDSLLITPINWGQHGGTDPFLQAKTAASAPLEADKKTLLNESATEKQRLAAAERLAANNETNFSVDGHNYRLEQENIDGKRSLVHVFAGDENGKDEHVMLRAVSDGNGHYKQEVSSTGRKVSFEGDWWRQNAARFASGEKSDTSPGREPDKARQETDAPMPSETARRRGPSRSDGRTDAGQRTPPHQEDQQEHSGRRRGGRYHGQQTGRRRERTRAHQGQGHETDDGAEDATEGKHQRDHHRDQPNQSLEGGHQAYATGYYPHNDRMEGGYFDQKSTKKDPRWLHTLQDFLEGKPGLDGKPVKEVTVAMDNRVPYGQKLIIPELDQQYAKQLKALGYEHIPFVKKDTGDAFKGRGYGRLDICVRSKPETHAITKHYNYKFVDSWGPEGTMLSQND